MESNTLQPIGYQALIARFNLQVIPHYRASYIMLIGGKRVYTKDGQEQHIYPKEYQLKDPADPFDNLEFALKHEGMNFSIIISVFNHLPINKIINYISRRPQGKAQRKIWYLFEFLMQQQLPLEDLTSGNYIDLLDPTLYYTTTAIKIKRQRINNTLLGFSHFCPFVRRTPDLVAAEAKQLDRKAKELLADYEPFITQRAASYLYTRETLSSWRIEHEEPTKMRAVNFVNLLRRADELSNLNKAELIKAQEAIVDPRFAEFEYRDTQNYVAETPRIGYSIIHYISPRPEDVPLLMQDLLASLNRMIDSAIHPIVIAATISFGFVYIHPFEDGNGRLHRFLIHYILARTSFTPPGIIFPVSAVMLANRNKYDQLLETVSRPLMDILTYSEDISGNLTVKGNNSALYAYLDYTRYAEYLFECIEQTIKTDLKKELTFIQDYDKIKQSIRELVDMPDKQIDLMIKLVIQNKGILAPSKRKKFFSLLTDQEITQIEAVIAQRNIDAWL